MGPVTLDDFSFPVEFLANPVGRRPHHHLRQEVHIGRQPGISQERSFGRKEEGQERQKDHGQNERLGDAHPGPQKAVQPSQSSLVEQGTGIMAGKTDDEPRESEHDQKGDQRGLGESREALHQPQPDGFVPVKPQEKAAQHRRDAENL